MAIYDDLKNFFRFMGFMTNVKTSMAITMPGDIVAEFSIILQLLRSSITRNYYNL